ncbi:head GIN domain-containing protein [Allopontixanthobacter sp.]|uniref:head GIN domain-containing protein n=1 Tax=Allopontixanthobacter sp. TaxID=2906452 RepID=UPI002ABA4234|nr:head GIN domain-containing protein [Allopontixanthobacter sp.]MDZ4308463.1 head GIN domain-containing protein [Allopontixanthobacter sp.]
MLRGISRMWGPLAAVVLAAGLAACDGPDIKINGKEGVPLADLDLTGAPPTEVVLAGPDSVRISDGETLAISVEGDQAAIDALRFSLENGTLAITRMDGSWKNTGKAEVKVTMPPPNSLTLLASGTIEAASLSGDASVQLLGSGKVTAARVTADVLKVNIAGSGSYEATGTAERLEVSMAGSGSAAMPALKADQAEVSIMGSGSTEFASDGKVAANIMGSGDVTVNGRATCTLSSLGSGKLTCNSVQQADK